MCRARKLHSSLAALRLVCEQLPGKSWGCTLDFDVWVDWESKGDLGESTTRGTVWRGRGGLAANACWRTSKTLGKCAFAWTLGENKRGQAGRHWISEGHVHSPELSTVGADGSSIFSV